MLKAPNFLRQTRFLHCDNDALSVRQSNFRKRRCGYCTADHYCDVTARDSRESAFASTTQHPQKSHDCQSSQIIVVRTLRFVACNVILMYIIEHTSESPVSRDRSFCVGRTNACPQCSSAQCGTERYNAGAINRMTLVNLYYTLCFVQARLRDMRHIHPKYFYN